MTRVPLAALLASEAVSITGNRLTQLAIPWFVLQTTGSVAQTGLVGFFSLLPFVLSSALGGVIVDRLGLRRASIAADLASGASVLCIPLLYHTVGLPLAALLALVFAGALLDAPGVTAREALLPDLVKTAGTTLERGTSLHDGVSRAASMLGAPLAGVLIALLGPANVLILDAATFAVSAFLMRAFVPAPPPRDAEAAPERYLAQLREGFGFVWRTPLVRAMVVMVLITNMLDAAMGGVLMPVYADRVLDSVVALGLMSGGMGLTAFLGTLVFAWIGHRLPRVSTLVAGFTLGGPSRFFFLATLPGVGPAIAGFTIAGAGIGVVNPILGTLQYERVPERLRARVFGAVSAGVMAGAPVGALLGAALVELIGLQETFLVFGTVYLACTLSPLWVPAWRDANRRLEPT
ncbi:MAG: transporter [Gaiellaceae bacterium]|nr:transporter [Gaiellaceae bacterium]